MPFEKDPGFFIEPRELDEVCVTTDGDRPADPVMEGVTVEGGSCCNLTRGVLGGRISVRELSLDPGGEVTVAWLRRGDDACFYCVTGGAEIRIGSGALEMTAGDSVHGGIPEVPFRIQWTGVGLSAPGHRGSDGRAPPSFCDLIRCQCASMTSMGASARSIPSASMERAMALNRLRNFSVAAMRVASGS